MYTGEKGMRSFSLQIASFIALVSPSAVSWTIAIYEYRHTERMAEKQYQGAQNYIFTR